MKKIRFKIGDYAVFHIEDADPIYFQVSTIIEEGGEYKYRYADGQWWGTEVIRKPTKEEIIKFYR